MTAFSVKFLMFPICLNHHKPFRGEKERERRVQISLLNHQSKQQRKLQIYMSYLMIEVGAVVLVLKAAALVVVERKSRSHTLYCNLALRYATLFSIGSNSQHPLSTGLSNCCNHYY